MRYVHQPVLCSLTLLGFISGAFAQLSGAPQQQSLSSPADLQAAMRGADRVTLVAGSVSATVWRGLAGLMTTWASRESTPRPHQIEIITASASLPAIAAGCAGLGAIPAGVSLRVIAVNRAPSGGMLVLESEPTPMPGAVNQLLMASVVIVQGSLVTGDATNQPTVMISGQPGANHLLEQLRLENLRQQGSLSHVCA